jgi:uroporphyrinogen-III synthase
MALLILTRPDPDNAPWLEALVERGQSAVAWPLIDIRPAPDSRALQAAWNRLTDCRAVMFVSRAAVQHFFAHRIPGLAWPAQTRAWCTGPGTRQALLAQGLTGSQIDLPHPDGAWDTEHLWPLVRPQIEAGAHVLLVRGTDAGVSKPNHGDDSGVGRDWLAGQLQQAGAQLSWAVAYERARPRWDAARLQAAATAAADGSIWVFSSSQALRHLAQLLPDQVWTQARALATHARIAEQARGLGFVRVSVCPPSAQGVLASLESPP